MALEELRDLAKEYGVRSPEKLYQLSKKIGAHWTLKECKEALASNVPAQTLGPPPRSLGHSAAEAPGSRLQADLMDFSQNTHGHHNDQHRYALQVSDVFTRKAYTEPLKGKNAIQVDSAMRKLLKEVPNQGRNAVLSTDKGGEFAGVDKVLPKGAAHRERQGVNDLSVVDRSMQTLKRDLEDKAQNNGQGWAHNLHEVTSNYNFRPNSAVHGAPDDAGKENAQQFMIYQDQAANFMHNRGLYDRRISAVNSAGAYREPIDNGGRSFKPYYGAVHALKKVLPGGGQVQDRQGNTALLKEVRPAAAGSGEPLAHITFQKRADKKSREPTEREPPPQEPRVGGSSSVGAPVSAAAAGGVLAAQHFSEAQLRRSDPVSAHIMSYQRKTTDEQRREAEAKKAAAKALRESKAKERIETSAAKEAEKQRKQLERMMRKG